MNDKEKELNQLVDQIAKDLPLGEDMDKAAVDLEIDFSTKREDLLEVLKPLGLGILSDEGLNPDVENEVREKLIQLFEANNK